MSNRIYILIAVAILIVSPIIVNMLSTALPPPASASNASETITSPDVSEPAQEEAQAQTPPPPEGEVGSTEPVFDVAPSMDPSGIAPAPIAGESGSESEAPPPQARTPEPASIPAPDQSAAPPPPPRPEMPASMNR